MPTAGAADVDAAVLPESVPADLVWQPIAGSARELSTRYGRLTVKSGRQCPTTREPIRHVELRLEGVVIAELGCAPDGDYYAVFLKNAFVLGPYDVVVLGAGAGGSGSPPQRLHLIVLDPQGGNRIEQDPGLRSIDGTERAALGPDRLWLDLGYVVRNRKIATFDGAALTIRELAVAPTPVSAASCETAYRALLACVQRNRDRDLGALSFDEFVNGSGDMDNATRGNLRRLEHHPGFDTASFMRVCAARQAGRDSDLAAFQDAVCTP